MGTIGSNGRDSINPHQRNANMTGTIIGNGILLDEQYIVGVNATESHGIDYINIYILLWKNMLLA